MLVQTEVFGHRNNNEDNCDGAKRSTTSMSVSGQTAHKRDCALDEKNPFPSSGLGQRAADDGPCQVCES